MNILITGTSKGIGKAIAQYYLNKGYNVIGISRSAKSIDNDKYTHISYDITNDLHDLIYKIKNICPTIDILINSAGIASMNHFLLTSSKKNNDIINLNYNAVFNLTREIVRLMTKSKQGRIINFSTIAVALSLEGEASYSASKAAVESLTKTLSKELAFYGITVNCIAPSPVETDLIKNVPKDKINKILEQQAIKKFTKTDDIINIIDFYISVKSNMITGQIIRLGGIN
ncbi:MAG: SDR family oxidoreductase [Halarcobacter sp.]